MFHAKKMKWAMVAALSIGASGAVQQVGRAGTIPVPKSAAQLVLSNQMITYHIAFRSEEIAEVIVHGDGSTALRVDIYDELGNFITSSSDIDVFGNVKVRWVPKWSDVFSIRVVNNGPVSNAFTMQTN